MIYTPIPVYGVLEWCTNPIISMFSLWFPLLQSDISVTTKFVCIREINQRFSPFKIYHIPGASVKNARAIHPVPTFCLRLQMPLPLPPPTTLIIHFPQHIPTITTYLIKHAQGFLSFVFVWFISVVVVDTRDNLPMYHGVTSLVLEQL